MKKKESTLRKLFPKLPPIKPLKLEPNKPLPQPKLPKPKQPDLVSEKVLGHIERTSDKISRSGINTPPGKNLKEALRDNLIEFEAATRLINRVIARDPLAEAEFRRLLYGFASEKLPIGLFDAKYLPRGGNSKGARPKGARPCSFVGLESFTGLYVAAMMSAGDGQDWESMKHGIDVLFLRAEWAESLYSAALHFERTHDPYPFVLRARKFARNKGLAYRMPRPASSFSPEGDPESNLPPTPWLPSGPHRPTPPFPPIGPPPHEPPSVPELPWEDDCSIFRKACMGAVRATITTISVYYKPLWFPIPSNSPFFHADNITYVTPRVCAGEEFVIEGVGFGDSKPDNVHLVLPSVDLTYWGYGRSCRIAEVPEPPEGLWSDTKIKLPCPDWVRSGPVGFLDEEGVEAYRELSWLIEEVLVGVSKVEVESPLNAIAGECGGRRNILQVGIFGIPFFSSPPATDYNIFKGTIPEVYLSVDDHEDDYVVPPDAQVSLEWRVINSEWYQIKRISGGGPIFVAGMPTNPPEIGPDVNESGAPGGEEISGTIPLSFSATRDGDVVYELKARNRCSTVTTNLTVHVRRPTTVKIIGIEVNQAIQTFDPNNPSKNNAIPLVQGKYALVRVYLESDLPSDYQGGILDKVTGTLNIIPISVPDLNLFPGSPETYDYHPKPQSIIILPERIDRGSLNCSLNYLLPFEYAYGTLKLHATAFSEDRWNAWTPESELDASIELTFRPTPGLKLYIFRVQDKHATASLEEVEESLDQLRSILPVDYLNGIEYSLADLDLRDYDDKEFDFYINQDFYDGRDPSHTDLFDVLDDKEEDLGDLSSGTIICAIVSERSVAEPIHERGIGWPGGAEHMGGTDRAIAYWVLESQKPNAYIPAHEIGHARHLDELTRNCGVFGVDLKDPKNPRLIGPNTNTMMYKISDDRWINPAEYLWMMGLDESSDEFLSILFACDIHGDVLIHFDVSDSSYSSSTISVD